jgi:hypothetical protein
MQETTIEVAGTRIRCAEAGAGATVLFLHDAAGASWDPLPDQLGAEGRVIAPEHPGFIAMLQIATLPADLTEKNLRLFARDVMPYLRGESARATRPAAMAVSS